MTVTDTAPDLETERPPAPSEGGPGGSGGTDHKAVGALFIVVGVAALVASGVIALFMRAQLSAPDVDFMWNRSYRQLFTLHGIFGVFVFLAPVWIGVATAVVPLQIGAARLAFPRLQVFSLCLLFTGAAMIAFSPFAQGGAITSGWSLSFPIPEGRLFRGQGPELLVLGLGVVGIALTLAAVNLIVTIVRLRAPGLTPRRMPLFSWSVLLSSSMLVLALPVLVGALIMLFVDQHYNGRVFSGFTGSNGGNALLWPRVFWFAAYPILWALLLPALGTVSEIIPVFSRSRLFSHHRARMAMVGIAVLAFAGWGSEVHNLESARWLFVLGALLVLAPTASLVLNWLATLGKGMKAGRASGEKPQKDTPMLYAGGFIVVLALGLAAAAISAVDATGRSHGNYWGVGMQHTLYFGTGIIAFFAAMSYWGPKLWGRHLSEGLGKLTFGLLFLGLLLTVVPMFVLGIQDMGVHLSDYADEEGWQAANVAIGIGGAVTVFAVVLLILNLLVTALVGRGRPAGDNPWSGNTLEWATTSPPSRYNFDSIPEIRSETPLLDIQGPSGPSERGAQGPSGPSERGAQTSSSKGET